MGWKKQAFSRKNAREMVKYGDGFGGILAVGEENFTVWESFPHPPLGGVSLRGVGPIVGRRAV